MQIKFTRFMITDSILTKVTTFLRQAVNKRGFHRVVFGLSGGIDSTVVARICQLSLKKEDCLALIMPSKHSNPIHEKDALEFCHEFNLPYKIIRLEAFEKAYEALGESTPLSYGNFCARIRMNLLYDQSQKNNALVIGTSNQTELKLGYGTLFGDLACAINPIAPFYKTEIYALAKLLGIPQNIRTKAPSADLYPNQSDEDELGYSYEDIDSLLIYLESPDTDKSKAGLEKMGFDSKMVESIQKRIQTNAFKRELPEFLIL